MGNPSRDKVAREPGPSTGFAPVHPNARERVKTSAQPQGLKPILCEVLRTPTGISWRRVDPLTGEVTHLADLSGTPKILDMDPAQFAKNAFDVLVEIPDLSDPEERTFWLRYHSPDGSPPSVTDRRPLVPYALIELMRIRRDGKRDRQEYNLMRRLGLVHEEPASEYLRAGERRIEPGLDWQRTWSRTAAPEHEDGENGYSWYERSYNHRLLRYRDDLVGALVLPIALETEQVFVRAELDNLEAPSRLEAHLYLDYLLLACNEGSGSRARLYSLRSGKLIWSSSSVDAYVCFWPRRRSPPIYGAPSSSERRD